MSNKHIVILMAIQGAGKTTLVSDLVSKGYFRINRDTTGGNLEGQVDIARNKIRDGVTETIVLDNTYPTIKSRASMIAFAKSWGAKISCHWLQTSFEDAQLNVCRRMIQRTGKLLGPDEFKKQKDPNIFPPIAQFNFRKIFEKPTTTEGFDEVIEVPFNRVWSAEYCNKALILDYDGTLRNSIGQYEYPVKISDIVINKTATAVVQDFKNRGYHILGASNQSGVAKGTLTYEQAVECFEETNRQLNIDVDFMFCPHSIPPVACYCRKPHVGLGAHFIEKYKLNPSLCLMVGDATTDETFAKRCGFQFKYAYELFK